ncbi:FG-GAP-like repeat-containing protein [Pseudomonas aeruginosa]|uniref:FG-GAP-like repeat-containing protein n=1 Tax=Pseudomonas aeruginosa TaxID=287 RepID=UPI00383BAFCA
MSGRWITWIAVLAICLMAGEAPAAGWRSANVRVYSGDYNGDGQSDIYLKAVTSVVVLGSELATPIPLLPALKNVVLLRNGASYSALYDPPAANLNAVAWTAAPYQSFIGDLNRDGILDLILQPHHSSDSLLIVSGNPSAQGVLQVASGTGLGTEIGFDAGARFVLGDWLGNGGTSIRVSHPTQGQSTLFIDAGGQLVARYLSVPTPLPGVVLGKAAEAFTALNLQAPQAGVGGDGGVDYRYPLELPPGIAGLQPELALVRGGGDGVLGEGWSLAGLSSIQRCPASIAQDGQNRQVGLLDSDRLCLDGMRLQLLSGEYFKPGSVYRTEIDSFARIQASGSGASLGFEVRTRDGRILTYGGAAAIKAQGATIPYQWGISSAKDRFGNGIEYRYLVANSLIPSEILYSGNRVSFEYAGALRSVPRYFAGGYTSATHVLTAVAVRGPAAQQLFRTELAYERTQGDASKVRLKQVQRCAWGSAGKECLSPVAFDYLAGAYGYTGTAESAGLDKFDYVLLSQASFVPADLNGDGRQALISATMGRLKALSLGGSGLTERLLYDTGNTPLFSLTRMDFNGDGKDEILFLRMKKDPNSVNADMQWMLYTGSGVVALGDAWTAPPAGPNGIVYSLAGGSTGFATYAPLVADLDQNGSLDLFLPINGNWVAYLNRSGTSPSFARSTLLSGFKTTDYGWFSFWGNDPGGGVRLAGGKAGKLVAGIWRGGSGMASAAMVDLGIDLARALTADVNGDGQMDYLVPNASGKVDLLLNTGGPLSSGLFQRLGTALSATQLLPVYRFRASLQDYAAKAVDYDGDGREEILYPRASGTFGLLRFTGNGFEELDSGVPLSRRLATSTTQLDKSCQDALAVWKRIMDTAPDAAGRESASWLYYQTAANCGFSPEGLLVDPYEMFVADVNGDGFQDVLVGGSLVVEPLRRSIRWRAFLHNRRSPELLSRIDAGSGNSLGIEYARLNDPAVHTPQVSAFPQVSLNIPRPVVSRLRVADGIGGTRDYQYLYQGARLDLLGRGFLGFRQMEVRDLARGRTQVKVLRQDFPFVGRLDKEDTSLAGKLVARQQNQWKSAATIAGKSFFVYPAQSNEERFDQGAPVSATRRKVVMDESYGNPTQVTEETAASLAGGALHSRVVQRQYSNDGASWLIGFVTRETESTSGDGDSKSRVQARSAKPGTLAPASETSFSGAPGAEITRQYSYDGNGRIARITTSGAGLAARSEQFGAYQGPWPGTRSNALGHVERFAYEAARGQPTSKVDANGLAESYLYDAFGRETLRRFADGSLLATDYLVCGSRAICASGAKVAVRTRTVRGSQQGAAERWQYLDGFGRVLRDRRQAFDGRWINVDNSYDALGRQRSTTEPYIEAATVLQTTWDAQDRPLTRQLPSGARISYSYGARAAGGSWKQYSLGYDGRSLTERREYDARGKLVLSTNALGSAGEVSVRYRYDADGNLAWTQVAGDSRSEIRMSYDASGRRTGLFDPNSGQESVQYDALGQALVRTASDGSRTERKYDLLGRVLEQTDRLGGQASISRWQYDTGTKSLGKLVGVAGPGYRQALLYDDLARLKARGWDIEVDGVTRSYQESYGYDGFSRLASTTLANGQVLRHLYNGYGFAAGEQDGAGTTLRQIQARDARDQIVRESYGNGVLSQRDYQPATGWLTRIQASKGGSVLQSLSYRYDGLGNLLERSDARGYSEVLSYDDLNRLLRSARTLDGTQVVQDFTYDALGNLTGKSGVGAYRYGSYSSAEQQLCAGRGGVAQPGPHAVRGTSAGTYCYDARGNQLSGPGRQVKYASFDKPVEISAGSSLSRFSYDPERKRYLQTVDERTSVYLDEGRFEEVNDGGRSWQDAYVGDYLILRKEGGAVKKLYLLRDALGSVEILLDANGAVSERQSFAAFGEHRGADWKDNGNQPTATSTRRGFTGHEHLEESGLVHMNGRVYDPVIGRFLSADIVYQDTANAQAYNRYSYGWNNPFASVDPTGYALEEISSSKSWYSPVIDNSWLFLSNLWMGNSPESGFEFGLGILKGGLSFSQSMSWINPVAGGVQYLSNNWTSQAIWGEGFSELISYKSIDQRAGGGLFDVGSVFLPVGRARVSVGFDFMFGTVSGAERGLGGRGGHKYAAGILSGGSGKAFAGHGKYVFGSGDFLVPDGTYITLPRPGINILDETGRFIELGDWVGLAQAAKINPRLAGDIEGMATYLPRAEIPNYTLSAPTARGPALHIYGNSTTVEFSTPLEKLLQPGMGCVQWAACTTFAR